MNAQDLLPFCAAEHNYRFASIGRPWTCEGFTYATDGRILIRVPAIEGVEWNEKAPPVAKLIAETVPKSVAKWVPLPVFPDPVFDECENCGGKGKWRETDESGKEIGLEFDCDECIGGKWPKVRPVRVLGRLFNDHFLEEIASLPGIEIADVPYREGAALYFRFDGGDGLLMPMKEHVETPD
jgi:hypothetical protein